ncbi:MAG: MAPEG family protein [Pseudomonadota bacterium]
MPLDHPLLYPMLAHLLWVTLLYGWLTIVRAPTAWSVGARKDGSNPFAAIEMRITANLRNQFEWPLFFYVVCLLFLQEPSSPHGSEIWLAWLFVIGRFLHSGIQIMTSNVRLRGVIFTVNFVAVLGMWLALLT